MTVSRSGPNRQAAADDEAIRTAVESVLRAQVEAWNRREVDAFVAHYWKSNDVAPAAQRRGGWEKTVRRYQERYPTRSDGRLTFGNLEITPLSNAALIAVGEFSLVFRKLDGRWVIVHGHTSRLAM